MLRQPAGTPPLDRPHSGLVVPSNVKMTGIVLDREHVAAAGELIRLQRNEQARALIEQWLRLPKFKFVVVGGRLQQRSSGIIGGLAADWQGALKLFSISCRRFDEEATAEGRDFTSAWLLLVTPERITELSRLIAESQAVAGHA